MTKSLKHFNRKLLDQMRPVPTADIHSIPTCHKDISMYLREPKWREIRQLKTRAIALASIPNNERKIAMVDYYLWVVVMLAVNEKGEELVLDDDDIGYLYFADDVSDLFPILQKVDDLLENLLDFGDDELSGSDTDKEPPSPKS